MTSWKTVLSAAAGLLATLALSGCGPTVQSRAEEEKEAHFLAGKSLLKEMDYKGAIDSFEQALETNPRSASAHFELAWLFDQKESDPAAAIFHYDRFLKLRPTAENEETIRARILACKQELARTVSLGPVTQGLQREFEQLTEENKKLREEVFRWREFASARARSQTNSANTAFAQLRPAAGNSGPSSTGSGIVRTAVSRTPTSGSAPKVAVASPVSHPSGRTHAIKPGETLTVIARKYGVRVNALMAANPSIDERRLRVGQPLTIPAV
jgi:LysM repeat protein